MGGKVGKFVSSDDSFLFTLLGLLNNLVNIKIENSVYFDKMHLCVQ